MVWTKMPYVETNISEGRTYRYYRRGGRRLASLPGDPGSSEFLNAWAKAHQQYEGAVEKADDAQVPGSFKEMAVAYLASPEFAQLADSTKRNYRHYVDVLNRAQVLGSVDRLSIRKSHVLTLRDKLASTPATANDMVKMVRIVYGWGILRDMADTNPADGIPKLKTGEWLPWPEPLIERYIEEGRPHLVWVAIGGLCTGQRIGDCLHIRLTDLSDDGMVRVVQEKTGKELWIPLHSDFKATIHAIPKRSVFLFTTVTGRPWTYSNFHEQFTLDLERLGIEGFVFHGLRKNAVHRLLEAGCSVKETGAITGQSDETVLYYARQMEQKKLARVAMAKLEAWSASR